VEDLPFKQIWAVDFEFEAPPGAHPIPVCLVAHELRTGREIRQWRDEFGSAPPYDIGEDSVFVAYYAPAELGCHLALGWGMPANVLDLFAEFRWLTNGKKNIDGAGLLSAMAYHGLDGIDAAAKDKIRTAIGTGAWRGVYTKEEILAYCATDVEALTRLLPAMLADIDLPRALHLRGRYMCAVAAMERNGIPLDVPLLEKIKDRWDSIKDALVAEVDGNFGVYKNGHHFNFAQFGAYLDKRGITAWPRTPKGRLATDEATLRDMARLYPELEPLRGLKAAVSGSLRWQDITYGPDGRNRCSLAPFRSVTARNQPGNSNYIFGASSWLRGLIKPAPGHGVAYIDWGQQEAGIAACLSGDVAMQEDFRSGDPYLGLAKKAGAVPADATKQSHSAIRDQFKTVSLSMFYGAGAKSLAIKIGQPEHVAKRIIEHHKDAYPQFWWWMQNNVDNATIDRRIATVFGWTQFIDGPVNRRALLNFPMQANGAEMMRIAACLAIESGVEICSPIHDAFLIGAPLERLDHDIELMKQAMREASELVLPGFPLASDVKIIRYPDRYEDPRGRVMWTTVMDLL